MITVFTNLDWHVNTEQVQLRLKETSSFSFLCLDFEISISQTSASWSKALVQADWCQLLHSCFTNSASLLSCLATGWLIMSSHIRTYLHYNQSAPATTGLKIRFWCRDALQASALLSDIKAGHTLGLHLVSWYCASFAYFQTELHLFNDHKPTAA